MSETEKQTDGNRDLQTGASQTLTEPLVMTMVAVGRPSGWSGRCGVYLGTPAGEVTLARPAAVAHVLRGSTYAAINEQYGGSVGSWDALSPLRDFPESLPVTLGHGDRDEARVVCVIVVKKADDGGMPNQGGPTTSVIVTDATALGDFLANEL